jgi:hypothetical protein
MRYVVLHHTAGPDPDHFDFLIERTAGVGDLATWRLPHWPLLAPTEAKQLRDHRRINLTHEGPISQNRGQVIRVDEGNAQLEVGSGLTRITFPSGRSLSLHFQSDDLWIARPD